MPVKTDIQVTASIRQTVEKRYPGGDRTWIPVFTGMTETERASIRQIKNPSLRGRVVLSEA